MGVAFAWRILGFCGLPLLLHVVNASDARKPALLVFTSVHRETALDMWALAEHLVSSRGYEAVVLAPEPLASDFRQAAGSETEQSEQQECSADEPNVIAYPSVAFEEYHVDNRGVIRELTNILDFHLASCASLVMNRTLMDSLAKRHFTLILGTATDPCSTLLADRLGIRRRAAYDDGATASLLWGVLLGQGFPTSHVATYGTRLGGGTMGIVERLLNVLSYYRLQLWYNQVYEPRLAAFRRKHRLAALPAPVQPGTVGESEGGRGRPSAGTPACHLRGQVVITGADWGLLEPQPLPPPIKLVGPLRGLPAATRGSVPALEPSELAAFVEAAETGVAVIFFPPDYRPPLRALLAIAEAVIDLKQRIVWQAAAPDIARVRQLYLPLKHARHVLMLPSLPLTDLLAQPQVVSLITAGSVQAIYAAVYAAKPVMAVPLNTAQEDLVARLAALGAGQRLSRQELEGGAASFRVSVAVERMSNVYSFTQSMQQLSTQLRATLGSVPPLERASAWLDYTASLDESGRQYLVPRSALAGAAAAGGGAGAFGGAPAYGGGGGCMSALEGANTAAYGLLAAAGLAAVSLVGLVFHVCTRVPPPQPSKRRAVIKPKHE